MEITFEWSNLPLDARVDFDPAEGELDILDLTCAGRDASFLLESTHADEITDAAYTAARRADEAFIVKALQEQAADRWFKQEEEYA